jgi:prepilin-type N-terminal cleavage/methylation domain-containing protein
MQEVKMRDKTKQARYGFTLIELLTVVAIIAMLIAIFGVGMQKIKISQRNLQQKAAFHSIDVGLNLFRNEFDGYPTAAGDRKRHGDCRRPAADRGAPGTG